MNKQDMLKIQTCALKMNIHCDGCKQKIKKVVQKVEGVYKVSIDVEQGKVTVSGNVDPRILIEKLEKAGKQAQLWGPQKAPISVTNLNNQFKKVKFENSNSSKTPLKSGKNQAKGGFQGHKDDEFDDEFDEDDDYDDEFSDEDFVADQPPPKKVAGVTGHGGGHVSKPKKAILDGHVKVGNGGNGKKSGGINEFLKGILGKAKAGGKNGKIDKEGKQNKGGNGKNSGGNEGKKNKGGLGKNSEKKGGEKGKKGATNGKGGGKINDSNFDGGPKLENKQQHGFNEINGNLKGGGRNMGEMGQMGNFQPAGMNVGHFQGNNPYNQQQMAQMMMMMNHQQQQQQQQQQQMMMNQQQQQLQQQRVMNMNGHNDMRYQPPMGYYGPPPQVTDQYTHYFNDENTDSCSIM